MHRPRWKLAASSILGVAALSTSALACDGCRYERYAVGPPPAVVYAPFGVVGRPVYYVAPVITYAPAYPAYAYVGRPSCDRRAYAPAYGPVYGGYGPGWGGYGRRDVYVRQHWRGW